MIVAIFDSSHMIAKTQDLPPAEALRSKAEKIFEALPVPKSATIRKARHFWTGPSSDLANEYPEIFGVRR